MKKVTCLSVFLCIALLLQCLALPVSAAPALDTVPVETTAPTQGTDIAPETPTISQLTEIPFGQVSILNGCRTIEGLVPLAGSEKKLDTAMGVFLYEVNTDTVIYSYNPDTQLSPGTLTKLVLALLVVENCPLDETVICQPGIQSKVPNKAQIFGLKSEEQLSVESLLYCLLLQGANDAAVALAEHVAGTSTACVEKMNQRVRELGCTATMFGNVSGLDTAVSYTTARDMAKIMRYIMDNEALMEILSALKYTVPKTNLVEEERSLRTTNYLIDDQNVAKFYDTRVKGGLPSYSEASGANLACVVENRAPENGGMKLVCVVLGCLRQFNEEPGMSWQVINYGNFDEMVDMIAYAYDSFKVARMVYEGQAMNQFPVTDGESGAVGQAAVNIDTVLPAAVQMDNLDVRYKAANGGLAAPISKGDQIATVELWFRNCCVAEAKLFSMGPVKHQSDTGVEFFNESLGKDNQVSGIMGFAGTVTGLAIVAVLCYLAYNAYRRARRRAQRRRRRAERRRSW